MRNNPPRTFKTKTNKVKEGANRPQATNNVPGGPTMGEKRQRQCNYNKAANALQDAQARSMDALAEFETFREMFLPEIRKALMEGLTGNQIIEKFKPIMMARLVQIGGTGESQHAISAIKEILDRSEGKSIQKQEHTHKLARLPEQELDAVLASKLKRIGQLTVDITPRDDEDKDEQAD